MLPLETYRRLLQERQVLGLMMTTGTERRTFYFSIDVVEEPNNLANYSLGSASAQDTSGTGWSEIVDSAGRYHLEPENESVIYHAFFGVAPGQAWIYQRYPTNTDLYSLLGTRSIGSGVGHIDGFQSPYRSPSPETEFFTLKGLHPSFLGYHPYLEPSSITVRLYFYIARYSVRFLGVDRSSDESLNKQRIIVPEEAERIAVIRPIGGRNLAPAPSWVETAMRK